MNYTFPIFAADISGSPLPALTGWTTYGKFDGYAITSAAISAQGNGYYLATVTVDETVTTGFVEFANGSAVISPKFNTINRETFYNDDDLYAKYLQAGIASTVNSASLNTINFTQIAGDDFVAIVTIASGMVAPPFNDDTLNGLSLSFAGASATSPVSGYVSISGSAYTINPYALLVNLKIAKENLGADKLNNSSSGVFYFDLQALNGTGIKKTIQRIKITLNRDYNPN